MNLKIKELPQEYTSKDTCYMRNVVPRLFKIVEFLPNTTCVDYGGGKYDQTIKFLSEKQVTTRVYDPYNRSKEYNDETIQWVAAQDGVDYICCANVLNIIKEEEVRSNVIKNISLMLKSGGTGYFMIYEGDKSGIGKPTGKGWQENRKAESYLSEIKGYFSSVKKRGTVIIVSKK